MALVDERNQDDRSDVIEERQERSEDQVVDDTGLDDTEDQSEEESGDERDESDEDKQGIL